MIQTLEFFDSSGNNLNFEYTGNIWKGNIFIPLASAGLYETKNIFIYDKLYLNNSLNYGLFQPINDNDYIFRFYFNKKSKNINQDKILLYEYDTENNILNHIDLFEYVITEDNISSISSGKKYTNNITNKNIKIPLALYSDVGGEFHEELIVELYNDTTEEIIRVAEINIYGEVEYEDDRLDSLLTNLNLNISRTDESLFSNKDPEETNTDWRILNKKRKEALLENGSLKNSQLSYEGLLNAIGFYGYTLGIREYWKNTDKNSPEYGKYSLIEVIDELTSEISDAYVNESFNKPNKIFKKTNFISLVYAINRIEDDKFDIQNLPLTKEVSKFSLEDVLVKLYSLKRKLSLKYLPIDVKVVDIIAEGDFFGSMNLSSNTISHKIDEINVSINPQILIEPNSVGYIGDLRKTLFELKTNDELVNFQNKILSDFYLTTIIDFEDDNKFDVRNINKLILSGKINDILNNDFQQFSERFISHFINNEGFNMYDNNEYIPSGYYVSINLTNFKDITISDMYGLNLDSFEDNTSLERVKYQNYYEISWDITYNGNDFIYSYNITGDIVDLNNIKLILPYIGQYTVKVSVSNLNSSQSSKTFENAIEVKGLNPDFIGIYKEYYQDILISDLNVNLSSATGTITRPYSGNVTLKDLNVTFASLDQSNYSNVNKYNQINNFTFNNLSNATLNDLHHLTFENTRFTKNTDLVQIKDFNYEIGKLSEVTLKDLEYNEIKSDLPTTFTIFNLNNESDEYEASTQNLGNNIQITNSNNIYTLNYGYVDMNDLSAVDDFILACENTFPFYDFNPLFNYIIEPGGRGTNDLIRDSLDRIVVTGNVISNSLDCFVEYWTSQFGKQKYNNGNLVGMTNGTSHNINIELGEINTILNRKTFKLYSQITFNTDNSEIPGRKNHIWTILNENTGKSDTLEAEYFTYFFKERGEYSIQLQLRDTNDNKYSIIKRGLIEII